MLIVTSTHLVHVSLTITSTTYYVLRKRGDGAYFSTASTINSNVHLNSYFITTINFNFLVFWFFLAPN